MKRFLILSIILTFSSVKGKSDTLSILDIIDIQWEWNSIVIEDSTIFHIEEHYKYYITFYENGRHSGLADCNRIFGTYNSKNANLTMKVYSTKKFCGAHSSDTLFTFGLNNSYSFKIKQDFLHILFENKTQGSMYKKGILIFHQ